MHIDTAYFLLQYTPPSLDSRNITIDGINKLEDTLCVFVTMDGELITIPTVQLRSKLKTTDEEDILAKLPLTVRGKNTAGVFNLMSNNHFMRYLHIWRLGVVHLKSKLRLRCDKSCDLLRTMKMSK